MKSSFRITSVNDLPELPVNRTLDFNWHVFTRMEAGRVNYYSVIRLSDGTPVLEEVCFSCDGKYSSAGDNHYQEVVKWIKEKYGKRFVSITRTYQDYDCGCYFQD